MHKPLLIGHRGARGLAPENTLLAMDAGIAAGCQWLELDVQLHPSGHLLVLHDLTLDRTTNGQGLASDADWDALRALDAGSGERLPTLDEVLDRVGSRANLNIELKTWGGTAAAVAAVLRARLADGVPATRFIVSSFHLPELQAFKALLPEVPVAVLLCGVPLDGAACATTLGAVALNQSAEFVDAALVADAKARGLQVNVYTVNDADEYARLAAMGIDAVFTDVPDQLRT